MNGKEQIQECENQTQECEIQECETQIQECENQESKFKKVLLKVKEFFGKIKEKFSQSKKPKEIKTSITSEKLKYDFEKVINSSQKFKSEDIIKTIEKEENKNYQKVLDDILSSKYAKDYEILGYLLYNTNEDTKLIAKLTSDEIVITYMYASLYSLKYGNKKAFKNLQKKAKAYSDNSLYKFIKIAKKMSFDNETTTTNKIKKFAKKYLKYIKDKSELTTIDLSLTKYLYRELGYAKVKYLHKIYKKNINKYNNLKEEDLLCLMNYLVKGYMHIHKFKQANEIIENILQKNPENYDAKEAKMFIEAKCTTIGEFINKKDINENQTFLALQTQASETKDDIWLFGINNIIEEFTNQKRVQIETRVRNVRKLVAGGSCGLAIILLLFGMFLDSVVFNVLIIIFMAIFMLSTLIRYQLIRYIKSNLKMFIISTCIKVLVGTIIIVSSFVLPNVIKSIIDTIF